MVSYTIRVLVEDQLWAVEQPFSLYGAELGIRMTIVRLKDGSLWLHSPVRYGENLAAQVASMGPVRHIVTPSKMHRLFVLDWTVAMPQAMHYVPIDMTLFAPGSRLPTTLTQMLPKVWSADLEMIEVHGIPELNEIVFFHRPSRTLILTDLCFNIREGSFWTRLFFRMNGNAFNRLTPTRVFRGFIKDIIAFRESLDRISRWDFDRVIVSHGDIVEHGGKQMFLDAFKRLR